MEAEFMAISIYGMPDDESEPMDQTCSEASTCVWWFTNVEAEIRSRSDS